MGRGRGLTQRHSTSHETAGEAGCAAAALEDNPVLKAERAVCNAKWLLDDAVYKPFVQAFRDKEGVAATSRSAHPQPLRPGLRVDEVLPEGLRMWDDTLRKEVPAKWEDKWGAGWKVEHPAPLDQK